MVYTKHSWQKFGELLILTEDLDPVYVMLDEAKALFSMEYIYRWCLAYWCFYHVGTASFIADAPSNKFHDRMRLALRNMPRGTERRHFRGESAKKAVDYFRKQGVPEDIVLELIGHDTFDGILIACKSTPQFGPWISFKVADMAERVLDCEVSFEDCELDMYRDPKQGAALIETGDVSSEVDITKVVSKLKSRFSGLYAPPKHDRKIGLQEVETILCKYKSHYKGHYPLGKDTMEYRRCLDPKSYGRVYPWGSSGKKLFSLLPIWDERFQVEEVAK